MEYHKDFADLCSLLNAKAVDYLIVGGYAVAYYGFPRFTGDLDILVQPTLDQVNRVLHAVKEFGFPVDQIEPDDLLVSNRMLQLGRVPVQIHIMTTITGVSWERAWSSRKPGFYGSASVHFIGLDVLLENKRAAGRPKDLADLDALGSHGENQ
jgi:hypothetical protein